MKIPHEKTRTWLRKGKLKRETESLQIAAQNNAIRTNYNKARTDKSQQNSRCILCGDIDEMINHLSECSKLAQKEYKTKHDRVGKVIHWELCKKFKFDHTNKQYMHNPEWNTQKNSLGFWDTNGSSNVGQTTRPTDSQQQQQQQQQREPVE